MSLSTSRRLQEYPRLPTCYLTADHLVDAAGDEWVHDAGSASGLHAVWRGDRVRGGDGAEQTTYRTGGRGLRLPGGLPVKVSIPSEFTPGRAVIGTESSGPQSSEGSHDTIKTKLTCQWQIVSNRQVATGRRSADSASG
jgi:hypothetical protein